MPDFHAEPFLYLAELRHDSALIAWGGFYFRVSRREREGKWKLVDDRTLNNVHPPRRETIGARSESYGPARVEVFDTAGRLVSYAETTSTNHAWITGLQPDTEYSYRVVVDGEPWAEGPRRDWFVAGEKCGLVESERTYDNRFRTHPDPAAPASLTFAVLGDFGTGVRHASTPGRRQREVAAALEAACVKHDVRLILTTGDNIYAGRTIFGVPVSGTGDEDDDWYFTYYQPYRYLLNRIPVYPSVGNHDGSETEANDDRDQLVDNFFIQERFTEEEAAGRASIGPGLFYRFHYGSLIEFVCLDTSRQRLLFGKRFFEHPNHAGFLQSAFPDIGVGATPPMWRIPFCHHPPYCAGPMHGNTNSMVANLVPLFERAGVRAVFSGHEHNFQYSCAGDVHYLVTGGGGKIRAGTPRNFHKAHTRAWAAAGHFLIVKVEQEQMTILPIAELEPGGELRDLAMAAPSGEPFTSPIVIPRHP